MLSDRSPQSANAQPTDEELTGLGGWLIVPIANLVIGVLACAFYLRNNLSQGQPLTSPGNIIFVVGMLYFGFCLLMIFDRRKIARYLMIAMYGFSALTTVGLLIFLPPESAIKYGSSVVRGAIELSLIFYFSLSRRVNLTLTN